ncbi:VWA domain-containing protein [Actinoplanes sp. LDG1-06]|uniref:VWA domain-containing protein n=1 Tax=Paractinoplanes ovalisporus TaxID=2810368 RepID=A0ABS2A830_9ACTN|nr:vWA domain-containing protein [Actinoplanes ovalisporus]MBM2616001.1 VWA domain-containing protein [Actinoplanes ovalisporus]
MREPDAYAVDIVFCIDVTGSMYPIVDRLKEGVLTLRRRIEEAAAATGKAIGALRVRLVAYRDFRDNPADALVESGFFTMPGQAAEFETAVRGLEAGGGGDEPESGLEALAVAMSSDWAYGHRPRRHLVVVLTDASAHPLGVGRAAAAYPSVAPPTFDELAAVWTSQSSHLLLVAPVTSPWEGIAAAWRDTVHLPSRAGNGLNEYALAEIVDAIVAGI